MAEKDSYMEEAYEMLKHMSVDEKKRLEYEAREKAIRDYHSQMQGMREEGFAEGKEQGKKAGEMRKATNIITNMLRKGKSPEEIADLTGEELEEVCRIGKHLGFLDQRQQEEHLQGCRERLQRLLRLRQKELEEKKHMYRCLGVAAGIFVILILV